MRKKKLLAVSLLLVILQIVSLFAMIPASAANNRGRSYDIKYTDTAITLNGSGDEDIWADVEWSENFGDPVATSSKVSESNPIQAAFDAKFKAVWGLNANEVKTLYLLLEVQDETVKNGTINNATIDQEDYFWFFIQEGNNKFWTSAITINGNSASANNVGNAVGGPFTYAVSDNRGPDGGYTVEMSFPISNARNDVFFDIMLKDNLPGASATYSWNGSTGNNVDISFGTGKLFTEENTYKSSFSNTNGYYYNLYQADGTMTIDGTADNANEYWNNIPWSEEFNQTGIRGTQTQDFQTKFKAMWDAEGYLYILMEINDSTTCTEQTGYVWTQDGFIFSISESGLDGGTLTDSSASSYRRTSTQSTLNRDYGTKYAWFEYAIDRDTTNGIVTIEAKYDFYNNSYAKAENTILFDIMSQDYIGDDNIAPNKESNYQQMCWNGKSGYTANGHGIQYGGKGYLSPIKASEVIVSTEAGAGTRLNDPAGLRFETHINKAEYDALVDAGAEITTGTLIVPTDYLTKYEINNYNFTKENLDKLNIDYLDVVNDGWAKEDGDEYVYYGSIVGIKTENLDRNFSGIGYMTVKTATEEYTLYGSYSASYHSRSVQYVAAAAIASGEYNDYLTTLQSFIKDSAPAKADGTTYRIMQYNLMRDGENWGGSALEIPYLDSSVRVNITSATIEGYNPDILVVNERFDDTWSELGLSDKYTVFDGNNAENTNAIVYNNKVFDLIEEESGIEFYTELENVNNRNLTYAILQDKTTDQKIVVFTTHWSTENSIAKLQYGEMKTYMEGILKNYADIPVVIAGDFNTAVNSAEYSELITEGGYTNVDAATSVDHIAVKGFSVVGQERDTKSYTKFASDHKPIYADIKIGG